MKRFGNTIWLALAWIVLLTGGCSRRSYPVTGTVVFKDSGQPAKELVDYLVSLESESKPVGARGLIRADGSFVLETFAEGDGAILGTHKVTITALQDMKDALPEQRSPTPPPIVPAKYLSAETSGLVAEVKAGANNEVNFELKD